VALRLQRLDDLELVLCPRQSGYERSLRTWEDAREAVGVEDHVGERVVAKVARVAIDH